MGNKISEYWDGVRLIEWKEEQGKVVRRDRQPSRKKITDRTKRLRNEAREAVKMDVAGLRPTALIPEQDWYNLLKINPDLNSPDVEIRTRAMKKFLENEGRCYVYNPPRLALWL